MAILKYFTLTTLLVLMAFMTASCTDKEAQNKLVEMERNVKAYQDTISVLKETIQKLEDQVEIFKYPADQRLLNIKELVASEEFDKALKEISDLKNTFPNSAEVQQSGSLVDLINKKKAEKEAEKQKIKAMGFKILKDSPTVKTKYGTATFGSFTFGSTFTFASVLDIDEYHYRTADKDNTYILVPMSFTSKEKSVITPTLAAYLIKDGKLVELANFTEEYATYRTYGAYIGNYNEDSHDFSKVSTVKYKLAAEIPKSDVGKPIIMMIYDEKSNNANLTPEYVIEHCKVVKVLNRNKL